MLDNKVNEKLYVIKKASNDFNKDYHSVSVNIRKILTQDVLDLWDKHIDYLTCNSYDLYTIFDEPVCIGDFVMTLGINTINLITKAPNKEFSTIPVIRFHNPRGDSFYVYSSYIKEAKRKLIKLNELQIKALINKTPDIHGYPEIITILKNRYGITV